MRQQLTCDLWSLPQEIDALFKGHKQNCVVYFLDETFEELQVRGVWLRRRMVADACGAGLTGRGF